MGMIARNTGVLLRVSFLGFAAGVAWGVCELFVTLSFFAVRGECLYNVCLSGGWPISGEVVEVRVNLIVLYSILLITFL